MRVAKTFLSDLFPLTNWMFLAGSPFTTHAAQLIKPKQHKQHETQHVSVGIHSFFGS
jgi:hypothetical protein